MSIPILSFKQAIWQALLVILLAGALALSVNHARENGITLFGNWSEDARFADNAGEGMVISLEQAVKLFENNRVLFIDARSTNQYRQSHIPGAVNIPWQDIDAYFMKITDSLNPEKIIVAYCDGETCDLSHELTRLLREIGFENAFVLVNGLTVWREAGLPVEYEP
jgi:rhodanese-related sulfurtransferase